MAGAWLRAVGPWIAWIRLGLALLAGAATISAQAGPITLNTRWRTGSTNLADATPHEGPIDPQRPQHHPPKGGLCFTFVSHGRSA